MNDNVITARSLTLLAEAAGRERAKVGAKWHPHRHGLVLDFLTDQLSAILRDGGGYRDPFGAATERVSAAFDRGSAEQHRLNLKADVDAFAERAIAAM
jgi:hypothetical protein